MADPVYSYEGKQADVDWNGKLCIHIGECGRAQGELFVAGRKPWCQPDLVQIRNVTDVVERCPTGALSYRRKDGGPAEQATGENTVVVQNRGPLYLRGELEIEGASEQTPGVRFRAALCRCGQSKNKPFCDNAHEQAGFKDYGAVGQLGEGCEGSGGPLVVKAAKDGPLLLSGRFKLLASSGRVAFTGEKAALCRCGESKNKPFCDGAHKAAGFRS